MFLRLLLVFLLLALVLLLALLVLALLNAKVVLWLKRTASKGSTDFLAIIFELWRWAMRTFCFMIWCTVLQVVCFGSSVLGSSKLVLFKINSPRSYLQSWKNKILVNNNEVRNVKRWRTAQVLYCTLYYSTRFTLLVYCTIVLYVLIVVIGYRIVASFYVKGFMFLSKFYVIVSACNRARFYSRWCFFRSSRSYFKKEWWMNESSIINHHLRYVQYHHLSSHVR